MGPPFFLISVPLVRGGPSYPLSGPMPSIRVEAPNMEGPYFRQ
jgi:hypothetical protein